MADDSDGPVNRRRLGTTAGGGTPSCLYPDEKEIALLVLGKSRAPYWKGLAVILERDGMPRVDPEFQARYWPAVKAFLDDRNHLDPASSGTRFR